MLIVSNCFKYLAVYPPIPVQYFFIVIVVQLFRLVSLRVGLYLYSIPGVGSMFPFLGSYTGHVAFGVLGGLVFNNWGYICHFSLLLLGCEVVRNVEVGSSFGTPQGLFGQRPQQA
ncbi:MAG: hypothetical protein EZS28_023848 [Streblomastix strix]|uniref:Uncharacterized protein n=1 Tax=Streblomastix strix TaxID=222440 RepID=A0A5J4VDJ7_9EUKA|nr:MAG: hypothetical protein EZS28_023848 [Streblomastix strix]